MREELSHINLLCLGSIAEIVRESAGQKKIHTSVEERKHKNNGNKFVNYTIQVAFANRRTRR